MRLLLLMALCLRFVPAPLPMAGTAHCGVAEATAAHAGHESGPAHHGGQTTAGEHAECPHCPPADCARHDHCPQPGLLLASVDTATGFATAPSVAAPRAAARIPHSTSHDPPVRPPLLPLA